MTIPAFNPVVIAVIAGAIGIGATALSAALSSGTPIVVAVAGAVAAVAGYIATHSGQTAGEQKTIARLKGRGPYDPI